MVRHNLTVDTHGQYMIMFTCGKCDHKQSKFFTKTAYHSGVVLVKCDGCGSVHVIADNLGWYGDKANIEDIMKQKNQEVLLGHADPRLLSILNEKVKETRSRFDSQQMARREQEDKERALSEESEPKS